jgi:hypothetical protein
VMLAGPLGTPLVLAWAAGVIAVGSAHG